MGDCYGSGALDCRMADGDDRAAIEHESARNLAARWLGAVNTRSVEALVALAHPEIELVPTDYTAPPGTSYHGHAGLRTFATGMFERFPDLVVEPDECRDLGGTALTLCRMIRTPTDGSPPEVVERALLTETNDALIRRLRVYQTEAEALEAAARSAQGGFRAVFDNAREPILLLDERGRVIDLNRPAARMLGVDREQGRGRELGDFVCGDRGPWDEGRRGLRTRGRSTGTLEVRTSDGRALSVTFWATADFVPGADLLLLRQADPDSSATGPVLTPREREIFTLLARGLNAREIADRLVLSPATVRTHVQNGVSKLEAATRIHAIALAVARGEIEP